MDVPTEQNEVYPQPSISPKVFVLTIIGVMILSIGLTVAAIYFIGEKEQTEKGGTKVNSTDEQIMNESPTPADTKTTLFESDICGISFEHPETWSILFKQETERACSYKVSDQPASINGVFIESLTTWEDTIKEYQDSQSETGDSSNIEKITFLGEDAYHITLNSSAELTLSVPVEYIFMKHQNAYFRITYAKVDDESMYQIMTKIIHSIRFTKSLDFYDKPFESISPFDIQKVVAKSRDTNTKSDMFMLQNALEQYYSDTFRYPDALSELNGTYLRTDTEYAEGIKYTTDGNTYRLYTVLNDGSEYVLSSKDK